jgi:hypothetical protein
MRSMAGVDPGHASVLDPDLLTKELDLLLESVVLSGQAYTGVDAIGSPAPGARDGLMG